MKYLPSKIEALKYMDKAIGRRTAAILLGLIRNRESVNVKEILIIRPGGLGDAVLLLPAIELLRTCFSDYGITVLCEKRNCEVFFLSKIIKRVYRYDEGIELARCLSNPYSIVIDTEQWHMLSAVIGYLTGAQGRIGFDTNERRELFTKTIGYDHNEYEMESFIRLFSLLCGFHGDVRTQSIPFIEINKEFTSRVERRFLPGIDEFIAISPGASVRERRYGAVRFARLAQRFVEDGRRVVITGSKSDKDEGRIIRDYVPDVYDLTGCTTLMETAAILGRARVFITADSGLLHLAYGLGTKTVSLFGSGIEPKWAPRGAGHTIINKRLKCSPCTRFGYTPKCPNNVLCLNVIKVEEIAEAAFGMLR